jgi:phospholipase C
VAVVSRRTAIARVAGVAAALVAVAGLTATGAAAQAAPDPSAAPSARPARTPIRHLVVMMQGDRTFDNYFGTYPGADGLPVDTCQALVVTEPRNGCVAPFAAHGKSIATLAAGNEVINRQFHAGRMDAFVAAFTSQGRDGTPAMGYYDRRDLPFSWAAADNYVLFDRFFASAFHGTRANRSYWVAAAPPPANATPTSGYGSMPTIFDRLQAAGVSWKFYVQNYDPKQTYRMATATQPVAQTVRVPLLNIPRFLDDPVLARHIVDLSQYDKDLVAGTLPAVSYIASSGASERSARSIPSGQRFARDVTTQLMLSRSWSSSALVLTYDGSGGWYDHVKPPSVAGQQLGFRVPTLLISPYARPGYVDHTTLDHTSMLKFIEQNWSVAPLTARDRAATGIADAFDFSAGARAATLLAGPPSLESAVVHTGAAYVLYGLAAFTATGMFGLAYAWPRLRRRREAATPTPQEVVP